MSLSRQAAVHKQFHDLLSRCNQAARPALDEGEFFQSLCDILVNSGLFQFAWFGYEDEVAQRILKPVAHSGDRGFLQDLEAGLRCADCEDSANIGINDGETCWIKDFRHHPTLGPTQSAALKRGCTSVISTHVVYDSRPHGAFTLYYNDPDRFGQYVPKLLTDFLKLNRFELSPFPSREAHEVELRSLIDLVPQHICLRFRDFSALAHNRAILDYYGRTDSEMKSKNEAIHPDDLERVSMEVAEGVLGTIPFEIECRLRRHDGEYRWFLSQN